MRSLKAMLIVKRILMKMKMKTLTLMAVVKCKGPKGQANSLNNV